MLFGKSLSMVPGVHISNTHTHENCFHVLYHEEKMLKIELHVFLTAQYNLKQVSPLMMFISCSANGICDPKEAKMNNLCCQILMFANLLLVLSISSGS